MLRIAVTGPESTGKTSLANSLSKHLNCPVIVEYARDYLSNLNRQYTYEDVEKIAVEQMKIEDLIIRTTPKILISDTELLVIKIWMQHKWGKVPDWLENKIYERKYDLYLLCKNDLPWEYDPLRENPEMGDYFFKLFKNELINRKFNFIVVHGNAFQRENQALKAINSIEI